MLHPLSLQANRLAHEYASNGKTRLFLKSLILAEQSTFHHLLKVVDKGSGVEVKKQLLFCVSRFISPNYCQRQAVRA